MYHSVHLVKRHEKIGKEKLLLVAVSQVARAGQEAQNAKRAIRNLGIPTYRFVSSGFTVGNWYQSVL